MDTETLSNRQCFYNEHNLSGLMLATLLGLRHMPGPGSGNTFEYYGPTGVGYHQEFQIGGFGPKETYHWYVVSSPATMRALVERELVEQIPSTLSAVQSSNKYRLALKTLRELEYDPNAPILVEFHRWFDAQERAYYTKGKS